MSATNTAKTSNTTNSKKSIADFFPSAIKKRKASSDGHINSCKQPKLETDHSSVRKTEVPVSENDSDVELLSEGKENTDLNVCANVATSLLGDKNSEKISEFIKDVEKLQTNSESIKDSGNTEKISESVNNFEKTEYNSESNKEADKTELCSDSGDSVKESSDEMNSSKTSLDTSSVSLTIESVARGEFDTSSIFSPDTVQSEGKKESGEPQAKKRKRMSLEEAKLKSEEREQKQKERLLKKQESEASKEQRRLEKERLKRQKEQEKAEKELERKEKERQRLEKKEQEELEKHQKLKEKEDKIKMKQIMLELKLDDKKRKEELKLKKDEEIKKAEEEKLKAKQEKERKEQEKKERNKAAFLKFFKKDTPSNSTPAPIQEPVTEAYFKPFQISDDMTLAPAASKLVQDRFDKQKLDQALKSTNVTDSNGLYLQTLKSGAYNDIRLRKRQRRRRQQCDEDVIVVDQKYAAELFMTTKLLQFHDNVRPPYWGTWRKKSKNIRPRNPQGQDPIFDYDVDSDDEWDEGGPGESLSGTENEQESEDDYEVDNEFFVPHGYLSAEEEDADEEEAENDPEKLLSLPAASEC